MTTNFEVWRRQNIAECERMVSIFREQLEKNEEMANFNRKMMFEWEAHLKKVKEMP